MKLIQHVKLLRSQRRLLLTLLTNISLPFCLDCLDNYQARDLLNKLAIIKNFDYLFASCAGTYGNVMAISPQNHPA